MNRYNSTQFENQQLSPRILVNIYSIGVKAEQRGYLYLQSIAQRWRVETVDALAVNFAWFWEPSDLKVMSHLFSINVKNLQV